MWLSTPRAAWGENWNAWRGPRGDGTSLESPVPTNWSPTENIAWKAEVPGTGHSSPIVWNDRIFLLSAMEDQEDRVLLCFDRLTGRKLWQQTIVHAPLEAKHELNSYASCTAATDGKLIYTAVLDVDQMAVAAFDLEGNRQWLVHPGEFSSRHGFCSCPVLFKNLVIVNGDHDGDSYIVALDRTDGHTVWKVPREHRTRSYVTPIIREIEGRTQMILSGSLCVTSYDPHDGRLLWLIDGPTEQFVASPVYLHGLVFLTAGFPEYHLMAIRPTGSGNVTETHIAWRHTKGAGYVPSPIAVGDYFLLVNDNGIASCFTCETGERTWMERLGTHFSGSPITADGLVYFCSDGGETTIVRPGPNFEVVANNSVGEAVYSSPAVSGGNVFIRGETNLIAIGPAPRSVAAKAR